MRFGITSTVWSGIDAILEIYFVRTHTSDFYTSTWQKHALEQEAHHGTSTALPIACIIPTRGALRWQICKTFLSPRVKNQFILHSRIRLMSRWPLAGTCLRTDICSSRIVAEVVAIHRAIKIGWWLQLTHTPVRAIHRTHAKLSPTISVFGLVIGRGAPFHATVNNIA